MASGTEHGDDSSTAMDLYTSQPPSASSASISLPPLPFSGSLMEGIFPDTGASSIFNDILAPGASTSTTTTLAESSSIPTTGDLLSSLALPQASAPPASSISTSLDFSSNAEAGPSTLSPQGTLLVQTGTAANTSATGSTSSTTTIKRGRGRPRKPPNAPTRTKYARITKEEMMSEDDDFTLSTSARQYQRSSKSSSSNGTTPQPPAASVISTGKGKERSINTVRNTSSSNSSSNTAIMSKADTRGKRPAEMVETRTKSGRTVHKPEVYVPTFEPSFRRRKPSQTRASTESQHCSVCGQGNSPTTNQIVLCDGCDMPYHQLCHDPTISSEAINTPDSIWYCHECELKRNSNFPNFSWEDNLPVSQFPTELTQEYIRILPREHLIQSLLNVIQHYPDARLFPANMAELVTSERERRNQARQARMTLSTTGNTRINSQSPALGESTMKRKRQLESSLSRPNYFEGSEDDQDVIDIDDTEGRVSKTPRRTEEEVVGISGPISPSKGNATTQTDDVYLPEGDERIRYPSHPEDRPGSMSYFEMLRNAIRDINDPEGVPPRRLYEWISEKYALPDNFRPSAGQALQKAAKKGHFLKNGSLYRVNPEYENMKAVKRPVRKSRPSIGGGGSSDISLHSTTAPTTTTGNSVGNTHQRNLSNQTTGSNRSTITSISEEGITGIHNEPSIPDKGSSEFTQAEIARRTGISLEEVIARQHNNTSADNNTTTAKVTELRKNTSPKNTFTHLTTGSAGVTPPVPQVISPQVLPSSLSAGNQVVSQSTFDPAPRVQQRHRPSVSFAAETAFTNPSQASLSASFTKQHQQQQHQQQPKAQNQGTQQAHHRQPEMQIPGFPQQIVQSRPGAAQTQMQNQMYGYAPSGDAGIDSMLAELMGQSTTERINIPTSQMQARPTAGPTSTSSMSGFNYPHPSQTGQQGISPGSIPARPPMQSRPSLSAGGHPPIVPPQLPTQANPQHQQQHQQQQQNIFQQQAHPVQQQQLSQQYHHAQNPYLLHNTTTDPAIFGGGHQNQFTSSQSPEMHAYNAQYGYQSVQQQHVSARQGPLAQPGQYNRTLEPGQ